MFFVFSLHFYRFLKWFLLFFYFFKVHDKFPGFEINLPNNVHFIFFYINPSQKKKVSRHSCNMGSFSSPRKFSPNPQFFAPKNILSKFALFNALFYALYLYSFYSGKLVWLVPTNHTVFIENSQVHKEKTKKICPEWLEKLNF